MASLSVRPRARAVIEKFRSKDEKIAKTVEQDCDARKRSGLLANLKNHGTRPSFAILESVCLTKIAKTVEHAERI